MIANDQPFGQPVNFIQAGWMKRDFDTHPMAFIEKECYGNDIIRYCRKLVDTGMTHAQHVWAIEYDPVNQWWCGNQDGDHLCYAKFLLSDVNMTSGNDLQYFSETIASYDQMGGISSSPIYHYDLENERDGTSGFVVIPHSTMETGGPVFNELGTPYLGNEYWDNIGYWAFKVYTNLSYFAAR